ncbi:unnamed protein product [Lymnaea stagnalis]|uniref:HHIP-like protein 2 n=1 Tax=Lymnaea stagnalis TaxID=6523 RepID=A0AAV2I850_LYMST
MWSYHSRMTLIQNNSHLAIAALLSLALVSVTGHPQCLDFRAPFKPDAPLIFCSDYSHVGCCSSKDDDRLNEEYDYIASQVNQSEWGGCSRMIKEILCQKCSPYAAHIYDAEGTSKARQFPGLCSAFCHTFYAQCRNLMRFLNPRLASKQLLASAERFCEKLSLRDVDYCYPDLLTNPMLQRNLQPAGQVPGNASGCLCLEHVKRSLANPLWARHAGDGSGRLFVAEQKGRVHIYNTRSKRWNRFCFLDLSKQVAVSNRAMDERGFLGLAFHPSYATNGRFFVYYSVKTRGDEPVPPELQDAEFSVDTKIRISELRVSLEDPDRADHKSEQVLLEVLQPYHNHNGGELMFGVDGYLYIFIGDGGGGGDPLDAGQNRSTFLGKVLRIDVDFTDSIKPYVIPPDNPFIGQDGVRPEIYAYGVRNIWRCGMDRGDRKTGEFRGRILCGDVGQDQYEEIDLLKKGANYGWNSREGFECYNKETCGSIGPEELPVYAYSHTIGKSVTGGVFYRGCENPALDGQYIYGDYMSSRLFSLNESGGKWTNKDVSLCGPQLCQGGLVGHIDEYIMSFGEDEEGEIYMLTSYSSKSGTCDGKLYKIVDPVTRGDPVHCETDSTLKARVRLPLKWRVRKAPASHTSSSPQDGNRTLDDTRDEEQKRYRLSIHEKSRRRKRRQRKRRKQKMSAASSRCATREDKTETHTFATISDETPPNKTLKSNTSVICKTSKKKPRKRLKSSAQKKEKSARRRKRRRQRLLKKIRKERKRNGRRKKFKKLRNKMLKGEEEICGCL